MRWIFFVLLGANILLFGWFMLFPPNTVAPQPPVPVSIPVDPDISSLILLRDAASSAGAAESKPVPRRLDGEEPARALCTFIGPFDETAEAGQLVERLAAMGVQGEVSKVEIPAGPGYWVYLEPLASRREALRRLAELQAQGVDSYVIPRGELANGISLGMFSKQPLAHARMQEMVDMGVDAQLQVVERSYQEIWVSIPVAEASELGQQAWARLLESQKNTERRQNFCLHVASQDNFH